MDYDVIVIGAGPAGLAAAAEMQSNGARALVIDRESFGGQVAKLEWIEDYPEKGQRIEGPKLAAALMEAAAGARMEVGEVIEVESYSGCRSVTLADGKAYTAPVVIAATGLRAKPLGIPGEDSFSGRGMIHCAFCDGGFYSKKTVAVVGGGDAGLIEALYLAKFAARVHLIEISPRLSAAPELQARAVANERFDIRLGTQVESVDGKDAVAAIDVLHLSSGRKECLPVDGVLIHAGFLPQSEYLAAVLNLDDAGYAPLSEDGDSAAEGIFVAGDISQGSGRRVLEALAQGKRAAANAMRILKR